MAFQIHSPDFMQCMLLACSSTRVQDSHTNVCLQSLGNFLKEVKKRFSLNIRHDKLQDKRESYAPCLISLAARIKGTSSSTAPANWEKNKENEAVKLSGSCRAETLSANCL